MDKKKKVLLSIFIIIVAIIIFYFATKTITKYTGYVTGNVVNENNNHASLIRCLNNQGIKVTQINMNSDELIKLGALTGCK